MAGIPRRIARQSAPTFGVNYTDDILSVRDDQVYKATNCHLSDKGRFFTRHGMVKRNTTALNGKVTSIYDYRRPDGDSYGQFELVTAGKKLYRWDADTDDYIELADLTNNNRVDWVTALDGKGNSLAFMCNGSDFKTYDGTVVRDVTFNTSSVNPRYMTIYNQRVLASGCDNNPYKVFVSAALDGTDWTDDDYWTTQQAKGDRVTGLGTVYNFGVFFRQFGIEIITAPDPDDTAADQIVVSSEYGTTSHWSIQSVGNMLYFADESHVYRGELREAIENGLVVKPIDKNIHKKYTKLKNPTDIVSAYDAKNKEIQWGMNTKVGSRNDTTLVYNIGLSGMKVDMGWVDVWSGWFENTADYEPYTLAVVLDTDGKPSIYMGDEDGDVWITDGASQYKDDSTNISSEIITGAIAPAGYGISKRLRTITPLLFQRYEGSTTLQWIIDGSYVKPSTARTVTLKNLVPYFRESTTTTMTQKWDSDIVWNSRPYIIRPVTTNEPFRYIQFIINNAGTNDADEISYMGNEILYQVHSQVRVQG